MADAPALPPAPPFPSAHVPRSPGEEAALLAALLVRPWTADLCPRAWFTEGPSRRLRDWLAAPSTALAVDHAVDAYRAARSDALFAAGDPAGAADALAADVPSGAVVQAIADGIGREAETHPVGSADANAWWDVRFLAHALHDAALRLPELRAAGLATLAVVEASAPPGVKRAPRVDPYQTEAYRRAAA